MTSTEALEIILKKEPRFKIVSVEQILRHIPYSLKQLESKGRQAPLVKCRDLAITVYYIEINNQTHAGKRFKKTHATVIHSLKKIAIALQGYDKTRRQFILEVFNKIDNEQPDKRNLSYLETLQKNYNEKKM
jgi:chromosomal replication initiation ATPase DnaA